MESKQLFVFDFDHTLIDQNSDTIIYELFEGCHLPKHLEELAKTTQWTKFMQLIYDEFNKLGVTVDQVRKVLRSAKLTPGMRELLDNLRAKGVTCIIASDSNSFFIQEILHEQGLTSHFSGVFTNPLQLNGEHLLITPYQQHDCQRCPVNICKSTIVKQLIGGPRDFVAKTGNFERLFYAGDGSNDLCPCLHPSVFCYARKGFTLEKLVDKHGLNDRSLSWTDGHDILQHFETKQ